MPTSRNLVYQTINFEKPVRPPQQLWKLPWAEIHYPNELLQIEKRFPNDIVRAKGFEKTTQKEFLENRFHIGEFKDHWGCKFVNIEEGIHGEVKEPLIKEPGWEDWTPACIPHEIKNIDKGEINRFCRSTDKFVICGINPHPFERLQYLRGSEQFFIDLALQPIAMFDVISAIHTHYCELLEVWAKTEVDALMIADDWGSQNTLLINPKTWKSIFEPLYKDYINIAHANGKIIFMHSDGNILSILPYLIDIGLDAINSQLFCMGIDNLIEFKGKISFWGEIDRQYLLPYGTESEVEAAVFAVKNNLWANGGCIAQCEFGPGAKPENVSKVFETWKNIFNI
jgi:uroporphyrinogen decarboxylase